MSILTATNLSLVRNSHVTAVQPHRVLLVVFNFQTQFWNISYILSSSLCFWVDLRFVFCACLHPNGQSGCVVMAVNSTRLVSAFYGYTNMTKYSYKKYL